MTANGKQTDHADGESEQPGRPGTAVAFADFEAVARWRRVAVATGPADRAAAEEGVRLAYRLAGLAEPKRVIWVGSPKEGTETVLGLTGAGPSVREEVRTLAWAGERDRRYRELGPVGWAEHWARTGERLWETTGRLVERIRTGVVEALTERGEDKTKVRMALLDAVFGQHDAPWLAALDGTGAKALRGIAQVARSAGWWWPYRDTVVIAERPVELHRDENGRLDRGDGPALAFPDGFALYTWRGMPIPAYFLDELRELTPERIRTEENVELRRVMLEHYGYGRYLAETGAKPVQRDKTGVLWRIELKGDEPVVVVEVVNSTPEPDGTHRTHWLRVPPTTRTARQGVAWTFGLSPGAYAPREET